MKKFLIIFMTIFTLLPLTVTTASAAENYHKNTHANIEQSGINDSYGLFDADELVDLNIMIQETSKQLDMNIYILVAGSSYNMSDYKTRIFSDDSYDEIFGEDTDGVFYFMDFTGKQPAYDYISTSGKAVLLYKNNIDNIFDDLYNILPPSGLEDYKEYHSEVYYAVECFLDKLVIYSGSGTSKYYYDESSEKYFYYKGDELIISKSPPFRKRLIVLFFVFPFGFIAALIFYFVTKHKYKFKASTNPRTYVENGDTHFTQRSDNFIRTYTTKTKIEQNHSSGGSSGGHSHSGGHGGGGRHR